MTAHGSFVWQDLTVEDADTVSTFYCDVLGWRRETDPSGDFNLYRDGSDEPVAGLCYARGVNASLPPQWLNYVMVADVNICIARCLEHGGSVIQHPRLMGGHNFAVLQDPAGAYIAILSKIP